MRPWPAWGWSQVATTSVETSIRPSSATTSRISDRFPSSHRVDSRRPSRRARGTDRRGAGVRRSGSIPAARSSSGVPSTATRSPSASRWSRPGHWIISPVPVGITATGARSPKIRRNVAPLGPAASTRASATSNRVPSRSISCDVLRRQTSTKEGAAMAATSSTLPPGVARWSALATDGFESCTTRRTSSRSSRMRSAVSRVRISSTSEQTTAMAPSRSAAASTSPRKALRRRWVTPQPSSARARLGWESSSITTTWVPLRWSCSTTRNPTPSRPQTITCP